jgi:hypothetical protein
MSEKCNECDPDFPCYHTTAACIREPKSTTAPPVEKPKPSYIGAPAVFQLELACQILHEAFDSYGIYLVGSALERPTFRDVDLRMIMKDEEFAVLFPDAGVEGQWECNPRWLLMTTAISQWLSSMTDLKIDFQFQPQTHANARHKKPRQAMGMKIKVEKNDG